MPIFRFAHKNCPHVILTLLALILWLNSADPKDLEEGRVTGSCGPLSDSVEQNSSGTCSSDILLSQLVKPLPLLPAITSLNS